MTSPACGIKRWRGMLVVAGGILIHLSLGTVYTFGNLNPYITSYMRNYGSASSLTYTECSWVFALGAMGQGASMAVGGVIERKIGPKLTALLGGWCMSLGVMLTYFAVKQSFALTIITYGAVFGFGIGIAYAIPLACCMRWFPERKGLVNGLVVAGFGGGAFIFNQVQTAFINPDNLQADKEVNGEKYFGEASILDQVPYVFLLLGGCYAGMQLIGSLLLCNPPASEEEEKIINNSHTQPPFKESKNIAIDKSSREQQEEQNDEEVNFTPAQMLKSKYFYIIWFIFLLNGQGIVFLTTLYKAYGQTFISDDSFLALVGAFAAVFNAFGRIMWGSIADRWSFRVAMLTVCTAFTALMLTLQLAPYGGKALFFVYICLLFGSFSGSFALLPTATAKCFGRKYLSINYGLVFTSQIVTAPLGAFLSQTLKSSIGWTGLFFMVSGFSFVAFLLTVIFNAKSRKGFEI
uniref:Major facilitator superfamily (MFS) profile domain-containing protein n=1 Tax=Biomphalaria glabrata TaxID=6526 RepID=A0A2C9L5X0_BIOGL